MEDKKISPNSPDFLNLLRELLILHAADLTFNTELSIRLLEEVPDDKEPLNILHRLSEGKFSYTIDPYQKLYALEKNIPFCEDPKEDTYKIKGVKEDLLGITISHHSNESTFSFILVCKISKVIEIKKDNLGRPIKSKFIVDAGLGPIIECTVKGYY